jgi:ankyrin repeat protein
MDDKEFYLTMFNNIKNHKWNEFKKQLENLDLSYDINIRDDQNNYFLTYATINNKPEIVDLLIERGAKIDIIDSEERSILYLPIKYGYDKILEKLIIANKENIGVPILDIKDKNRKIALHYAIVNKNIFAINLLLEFGSNPNTQDDNGYNSLHYAIYSRNEEICNMVIKYIVDINARCKTGETALHIACNLQLVNLVKLLLKHNINANIQDFEHEFAPIHYSISLNNREITMLLLEKNIDPNLQDVFGNTASHYAIIEGNYELLNTLVDLNNLNINLWNIDGKIPLHILLDTYDENKMQHFDELLKKSNVSIQDNEGNSCLFIMIKLNIWKKYKDILSKKKLDIFSPNKINQRSIDIVDNKDFNDFIDLVSSSYINKLKKSGKNWTDEWQNLCSREFKEEDKISMSKFFKENINSSENLTYACKKIIKKRLIEISNLDVCNNKSYPSLKNKICIKLTEGEDLSMCTFTGNTMDVLIGLIYILKKYGDVCSTLSYDFVENSSICDFYRSIGIIMNNRCEFLNFEVVWVNQKLYLTDRFFDKIKNCINKKKKIIVIPLGIEMKEGSHAGYIIYDIEKKIVERFEPHGATAPAGLNYNPNLLDDILENRFKVIDDNIKYFRPSDYLPKIGFQLMDIYDRKKKKIGDPGGFCALWALWYVDMRLTYRDLDNKELVKLLIKSIKTQNISIKNMIRNYAKHVIEIRDRILSNANLNINMWLNDEYTDEQINKVLTELKYEISKI